MKTIKCTLNCERDGQACLHMRPAKFIVNLCRAFPKTEFRILKHAEDDHSPQAINPKSIMSLVAGSFSDGKEVTVEIDGKCEIMASEF